jgi:serine/threonine-protein kinase RsbW
LTKNAPLYELKLLSQSENLELIREFVSKIALKAGFGTDDINKIELAVDEACANVIQHAYSDGDTKQTIHLIVQLDYHKITIIVADEGKGFDVHRIKDLDMKEYIAEMRIGGLGIHLIKNLMDKVEFNIEPGKRNEVRMIKYYTTNEGTQVAPREFSTSKS